MRLLKIKDNAIGVLFDEPLQVFQLVKDMDANAPVKSSRFKHPNVLALEMRGRDLPFSKEGSLLLLSHLVVLKLAINVAKDRVLKSFVLLKQLERLALKKLLSVGEVCDKLIELMYVVLGVDL